MLTMYVLFFSRVFIYLIPSIISYDVAFRAGEEPEHFSRADFLAKSALSSSATFETLKDGSLAPELIKAPWDRSLKSTLQCLDKDFHSDPGELMGYIHKFNLDYEDEGDGPNPAREFERAACKELAVDLALSSHTFSDTPFSKPSEIDQTLETMTEALSLGGEPPPLEFGYLKPIIRRTKYSQADDASTSEQLEVPMGVRMLLKDWDTSDPEKYSYSDLYGGVDDGESSKPAKSAAVTQLRDFVAESQRPPHIVASHIQRPPAILASSAVPPAIPDFAQRAVPRRIQQESLPVFPTQAESQGSRASQDALASTQVLPGPYGGRPAVKKKVVKKRMGGF